MSRTRRRTISQSTVNRSSLTQNKLLDEEIYELENLPALQKVKYTTPILLDPETNDKLLEQHYLRAEIVLLAKGLKLKWRQDEDNVVCEEPIVSAIDYVLNPFLLTRYSRALLDFSSDNYNFKWLFHGSSTIKLNNICLKGFYKPGQVSYEPSSRNKGYFDYGCYFSNNARYAHNYSAAQNSNQILLCRTICGKIRTVNFCLGATRTSGFDSHISQCLFESVLFHVERILPVYIVHLEPPNK